MDGDDELLAALDLLARGKRRNDAAMLAHIAEVDRRRLYAGKGYSSMFEYCVKVLQLSEWATSKRVRAARLSRAYPELIDMEWSLDGAGQGEACDAVPGCAAGFACRVPDPGGEGLRCGPVCDASVAPASELGCATLTGSATAACVRLAELWPKVAWETPGDTGVCRER